MSVFMVIKNIHGTLIVLMNYYKKFIKIKLLSQKMYQKKCLNLY
jgi:hypothetical protein